MNLRPSILLPSGLVLALTLAGCGGGGGDGASPQVPPDNSAAQTVLRQQSLSLSKGVMDSLRVGWALAADVQNIIVLGPLAIAQPVGPVACSGGGTLTLQVLRPASDPAGGRYIQQYDACREFGGVLIQGTLEVTFTRVTTEAATQPWAGAVRFENYSISSTGRERRYHGLATAQGELRAASGAQEMTMQLTDFRLRDTPDTLGLGATFSTTRFDVQRLATGRYAAGGRWLLEAGGLQAALDLQPGSRFSLAENTPGDSVTGRVTWQQQGLPALAAGFSVLPVGRTSLRVALDVNEDGTPEYSGEFDRYADLGFSL